MYPSHASLPVAELALLLEKERALQRMEHAPAWEWKRTGCFR